MSKYVRVIGGDDDGRCLAIVINIIDRAPFKLFSVYFPCYSASIQYNVELNNSLRFIQNLLQPTDDVIIVGDVNFTCSMEHTGFVQCRSVLDYQQLTVMNSVMS
jgi:exonuclease III